MKETADPKQQLPFCTDAGHGPNGDVPMQYFQPSPHRFFEGEGQLVFSVSNVAIASRGRR